MQGYLLSPDRVQRHPTIHEFIAAAHRVDAHGELVVQGGRVYLAEERFDQSESQQQLRKRTWEAFERAIRETFTERRIEKVCRDYAFSKDDELNWFKFKQTDCPALMSRHVEMWGVASANIHVADLLDKGDPSELTLEELHSAYIEADPIHCLSTSVDHTNPRELYEYFGQAQVYHDRRRINFYKDIHKLSPHSYLQRLAMVITSCEPPEGALIPAPTHDGGIDFYKVHCVVAAEGLYAVALTPVSKQSKLKKTILFRPTATTPGQTDMLKSWINNVEELNGLTGYTAGKKQLAELMKDPTFRKEGEKIVVSAYSLGGAHCGYFCRDFWPDIEEAVFFNDVSNSDTKVAEDLAKEINALPDHAWGPKVTIYRAVSSKDGNYGDWAHYMGKKHVFWGIKHPGTFVRVISFILPDLPVPRDFSTWGRFHSYRYLDEGGENPYDKYDFKLFIGPTLVDRELDNDKRGERIRNYEVLRRSLGTNILYHVISVVSRILDFIFRFFGIPFLRMSE